MDSYLNLPSLISNSAFFSHIGTFLSIDHVIQVSHDWILQWENSIVISKILSLYSVIEGWASQFADHKVKMLWCVLILNILLIWIGRARKQGGELNTPLTGFRYALNCSVFSVLSLVELFHSIALSEESAWYLHPSEVGWIWVIVNFFLFLFVVINQSLSLIELFDDVRHNTKETFRCAPGFWIWVIGIFCLTASWYLFPEYFVIIATLLGVIQLTQMVIIAVKVSRAKGVILGLTYSLIYQVSLTATLMVCIYFIPILLVGGIIFLVIRILNLTNLPTFSSSSSTDSQTKTAPTWCCRCSRRVLGPVRDAGSTWHCPHCGGTLQ